MALRKTRLCKARSHATDTVCAACSLIRKNGKELFKVPDMHPHALLTIDSRTDWNEREAKSAPRPRAALTD